MNRLAFLMDNTFKAIPNVKFKFKNVSAAAS